MKAAAPLLAVVLALSPFGASAQDVLEPPGYRMEEYRAPVPATLQGARVIDTQEAHALWEAGDAAFVDVLPRAPRPADLPEGTLWRPAPRDDIPGSLWLPDTGFGALSPEMQKYLEAGLDRATDGDPSRALVIYCQAGCWMSWNAAKRALEAGHETVLWYPEGSDGWADADLPLERREPEPGRPED